MLVLCNPCARTELRWQERTQKLCSATLKQSFSSDQIKFNKLVLKPGTPE